MALPRSVSETVSFRSGGRALFPVLLRLLHTLGRETGGVDADTATLFVERHVGLAAETVFKGISGRSWPDPAYVQNHLYGFHFLQGDPRASSFPSGHSIIAAAIVTVLWIRIPRLRIVSLLLASAVMCVLIVTNFHWVSDVIAGAYLGVAIGWMTVRLDIAGYAAPPKA